MIKAIKTLIWGDQALREASLPYHKRKAGIDYKAPFSIANPACYGNSVPTGNPDREFMLLFIKNSRNKESELNFALEDLPKYDYWTDYYIEDGWPRTGFRFATMVESYCYEKDIQTNQLPTEPTFVFWEPTNVRFAIMDEGKVY